MKRDGYVLCCATVALTVLGLTAGCDLLQEYDDGTTPGNVAGVLAESEPTGDPAPHDAADARCPESVEECRALADALCRAAGYDGVGPEVELETEDDGRRACKASCVGGGTALWVCS